MFAHVEMTNLGRAQLLAAIIDYRDRHCDETETVARFAEFVRNNANCFERANLSGHITASGFVLSADRQRVLLMHHRKLNRWLQPGGHADGISDTAAVACKELSEETGLKHFECRREIFDLDIHPIPARGEEPAHLHFDVRHLMIAADEHTSGNHESLELRWFALHEIAQFDEPSIRRMATKAIAQAEAESL